MSAPIAPLESRSSPTRRLGGWALAALAVVLPISLGLANVFAGLSLAVALGAAIVRRQHLAWRRWRWPLLGLGALWLTHLVATALSPRPRWDTLVDELWLKSLLIAVPILGGSGGRDGLRGLRIFALVGVAVAAFSVTQHFHGWDPWRGGTVATFGARFQSVGFFGHHLSYGGHLLVVFAVLLAEALWGTRRRLAWAGLCIVLLALLWSYARSAQLGAMALTLGLLWQRRGVLRKRVFLALAVLALVAAALPSVRARWTNVGTSYSDTTRLLLWESSVEGIRDRPLSGWGPGNFKLLLAAHERPGEYESRAHAHNDLLMFAVNAGLPAVGAALLLWFGCWRVVRGPTSMAPAAALGCLVAFAVAGMFQVYQSDDEVEMALYFVLGHGMLPREIRPS